MVESVTAGSFGKSKPYLEKELQFETDIVKFLAISKTDCQKLNDIDPKPHMSNDFYCKVERRD